MSSAVKDTETFTQQKRELKVVLSDLFSTSTMKPNVSVNKGKKNKSNGIEWDDEHVKYKFNASFNKAKVTKPTSAKVRSSENHVSGDSNDLANEGVLYKFPRAKPPAAKNKAKNRIKIKFWSSKTNNKAEPIKNGTSNSAASSKKTKTSAVKSSSPKLRQKVSFLPPPLFTDQHVPMVTVPDDLTVHFNEEEANDLLITADSLAIRTAADTSASSSNSPKKSPTVRMSHSPSAQNSPRSALKRKRDQLDGDSRSNDADLEYFAKYVVQKLRKMETNQRIYSENLINTVLMLGQLQKLNGKSKVSDT